MSGDLTVVRDARAEARAFAPAGHDVRTLEPSPPALIDGEFFADDPAAVGPVDGPVVTPTSAGTVTWGEVAASGAEAAEFAADRWLGAHRRLGAVPDDYPAGRTAFHRLAYSVVAAARHQTNGKFGLRFTAGGFGTPFFGDDEQVRMVGDVMVLQSGGSATSMVPGSIAEAAMFVGVEPSTVAAEDDSPDLGDVDASIDLRADVGAFLGDWFGFATSVLEELRLVGTTADAVGRVQLWPGHFDPAVEIGDAEAGSRATFGASPGDDSSAEPYLYVGAWGDVDAANPYWNATTFAGATLPFERLLAADDQRGEALRFFRTGYDLLHG